MTRRAKYLAAPAILLALAAPAHAALPTGNLLQNGDAEGGPGVTNSNDTTAVPGWDAVPGFTAVVYGSESFPSREVSAAIGGGANFFAGGPDQGFGELSIAAQQVDLSPWAADLDGANVTARLTADLGGLAEQEDAATVSAVFTNRTEQTGQGAVFVGPVTAGDRGNVTTLLPRSACVALQPRARDLIVQMAMQRRAGLYNDGYADNVSITLSTVPCPPAGAAPDAPLPPPAPPMAGVSGNAEPVSGRVRVKVPGSDEFQELDAASSIPVGTEIDTTQGRVELETAADTRGTRQTAQFYSGQFVLAQTKGSRPITELRMSGGRIDTCPRRGRVGAAASRSRRLWGNGRGRFRTRGRYASASVRGTIWYVRDTCTSTEVRVRRGSVTVRDLVKRRNVVVKAGKRYIARARR